MGEPLGSTAGHLTMSQLDRKSVKVVEEEADRLVDRGIAVLENLHLKVKKLPIHRGLLLFIVDAESTGDVGRERGGVCVSADRRAWF